MMKNYWYDRKESEILDQYYDGLISEKEMKNAIDNLRIDLVEIAVDKYDMREKV